MDIESAATRYQPIAAAVCARVASPSGKMGIRYGLAAIKNVGEGAMAAAIKRAEMQNGESC